MGEITTWDFPFEGDGFNMIFQVRQTMIDGEPWFVASDVCKVLGVSNVTMALSRLDEADFSSTEVRSGGQRRAVKIVNESGLYDLILDSRKPEAKVFRRWVTAEVLPTIRKTGGSYVAPGSPASQISPEDTDALLAQWEQTLEVAKKERQGRIQAEAALSDAIPRTIGAVGAEKNRGGQLVWDLRDEIGRRTGINPQKVLTLMVRLGVIERRGQKYKVLPEWDDILFCSETRVPGPNGDEYVYTDGPVRIIPGRQDEFITRLMKAFDNDLYL